MESNAAMYIEESPGKGFRCKVSPERRFGRKDNALRHARGKHVGEQKRKCPSCGKTCRKDSLERHLGSCVSKTSIQCIPCNQSFSGQYHFLRHQRTVKHNKVTESLSGSTSKKQLSTVEKVFKECPVKDEGTTPIYPDEASQALKDEICKKWYLIKDYANQTHKLCHHYNLRMRPGVDVEQTIRRIFEWMDSKPFLLAIEPGFMLRRTRQESRKLPEGAEATVTVEEFKYFYPEKNVRIKHKDPTKDNQYTDRPKVIDNIEALNEAIEDYRNSQVEDMIKVRPTTEWHYFDITNIRLTVIPLRNHTMVGMVDVNTNWRQCKVVKGVDGEEAAEAGERPRDDTESDEIQKYINLKRSIRQLRRDKDNVVFRDNLCMFRCIADLLNTTEGRPRARIRQRSNKLYRRWCQHTGMEYDIARFPGVTTADLSTAESLFGLNIYVHELYIGVEQDSIPDLEEDLADLLEDAEPEADRQARIDELLADAAEQGLLCQGTPADANPSADSEDRNISNFIVSDDEELDEEACLDVQSVTPSPGNNQSSSNLSGYGHSKQIDEIPSPVEEEERTTANPPVDTPEPEQVDLGPFGRGQEIGDPPLPEPIPPEPAISPVPSSVSATSSYVPQRIQARTVRRPVEVVGDRVTLHLLEFNGHYSRITSINQLCRSWKCQRCSKYFTHFGNCKRHQKNCQTKTKKVYKGGGFTLKPGVFDRLSKDGYTVPKSRQFYPHYMVFDMEAWFQERPQPEVPRTSRLLNELVPLSGSVISTLDLANGRVNENGQMGKYNQAEFFVDRDPKVLVKKIYDYLKDMSQKIGDLMAEDYREEIEFTKANADLARDAMRELKAAKQAGDEGKVEIALNRVYAYREHIYTEQMLLRWVRQVPVIGFNSGRFDINLMRQYLLPLIAEDSEKKVSVIERGTDYMAIGTDRMIWLDMCHYLPPGTSLDAFTRAYCPEDDDWKYYWPYEHITSYDVLSEGRPDREMFFSKLKNREMTADEYTTFCELWDRHGCKTLMDWLKVYNNQDVRPFLKAIGKMVDIFSDLGIDMFKQAISLPGVAMRRMFSQQGQTIIPMFSEDYKDWHQCFKDNIVGGPSIVFRRKIGEFSCLKKGGLWIRCKKILGYDANSLYLHCTGQKMPTGIPRDYQPEHGPDSIGDEVPTDEGHQVSAVECKNLVEANMRKRFKYHYMCKSSLEVPWVLYWTRKLEEETGETLTVEHALNGGQRMFLSPDGKRRYYLDGYIASQRYAIEYNGCYYHGHTCDVEQSRIRKLHPQLQAKAQEERAAKFAKYQQRVRDLEQLGLTVKTTWSCQWCGDEEEKKVLEDICREVLPYQRKRYDPVPAQRLLDEVQSGQFFGAIECDLQVPWWEPSKREEMKEFPPIFKNVDISREEIGDFMREYAVENELLKTPRRNLISSFHGSKLLVITPLLQYLMKIGVVVTRIHKAIQFCGHAEPFKFIVDEVTAARREADTAHADAEVKAKGAVAKLYGNSCYGKSITNVDNHEMVQIMHTTEAELAVNGPKFKSIDPINEDYYLVHQEKNKIIYDLPILIGSFVYGYAKLRMLQFYYDFLSKVIHPTRFELIQMDTDSIYFGLASDSLAEEAALDYRRHQVYIDLVDDFIETTQTKRQPGLFKLEWEGQDFVALNSKCYFGRSSDGDKVSCKGISHLTNKNILTFDEFEGVVDQKQDFVKGANRGFKRIHGHLESYEQKKTALTYLYIKRKCLGPDGILTEPLDI